MRRSVLSLVMVAAALASACGGGKAAGTAPSPVPAAPSTPAAPVPAPSAPACQLPERFIARNGITTGSGFRNEFAWTGTTSVVIELQQRLNVPGIDMPPDLQWSASRLVGVVARDLRLVDGLQQFELHDLPVGIFRARVRPVCGSTFSLWMEFSNDGVLVPPVVTPPACTAAFGPRPAHPCSQIAGG